MRVAGWASALVVALGGMLMVPLDARAQEGEADRSAAPIAEPEENGEGGSAEPSEREEGPEGELRQAEASAAAESESEESGEAAEASGEAEDEEPAAATERERASSTTTGADFWRAPERPPFYETWWFWTSVGLVTLGVTLSIVIGVTTDHPRTTTSELLLDHFSCLGDCSGGASLPLVFSMGW